MNVGAERSPVVVNVKQADFPATGGVEIYSAAYFIRDTVGRSGVAACAGNRRVSARSARQAFDKWSDAPAIPAVVEVARTEMISVEDVLGAADCDGAVAAVRHDLQPRLEIPAQGTHAADVQVGPIAPAAVETGKGIAAKNFNQRSAANTARVAALPCGPHLCRANGWRCGLSRLRLCRR